MQTKQYHLGNAIVVATTVPDGSWMATFPNFTGLGHTEGEALLDLANQLGNAATRIASLVPQDAEHDIRERFARWLILSGRMSRELFLKLWAEYEDDGQLSSRDPHPQRTMLVEDEPKQSARFRLSIATSAVRGGYIDREFTATDQEAFTQAATEIKNGSPLVLVYKNDEQIAELRVTPAVPRSPRFARVEETESPATLDAAINAATEGADRE